MAKLQDEINSDKLSHGGFGITDRTEPWVWIHSTNPRLGKRRQRHSLITGRDHQGHLGDSQGAGLRCLQLQENVIHKESNSMLLLLCMLATKGKHPHGSRGCKQHSANAGGEGTRGVTKDADGGAGKQHEQQLRLFLPTREKVKYSKSNKIKHAATMDAPLFSANVFYPAFPRR